ncbi:dihydrolipoyl dehydrogenase family protein [Corynebacterium suicordis]|uniref:FAD-dependent oxidoreductase n=1 Tax=Corynebacterium suicordis DSM 45110 TaxID=1121369 RepID=A0ABR9ZHT3_9CORY|nr:FAD-dependent oxidoreductase [Corynebacterium suicordis]MBF4552641.1 FAD-dependent oxidoreductase [Corynebacterium suicordis DSM 45110]MDR6278400.1 pyruvate/2-oxoglutarate dehydrogenase complex dihydrolipoamide dehydrogenase (E3) component [Corynebacterium suicordis]
MSDSTSNSSDILNVDIAVIGWGKGGKTLAATLGGQGKKVAMIEEFEEMHGGTCINIGCVPTKTLIHDSEMARAQQSDSTGAETAAEAWSQAVERRDQLIEKLRGVNHGMLADVPSVTLVSGRGRFVAPKEIEVTHQGNTLRVQAETIIINTGAVPVMPEIPGIDSPKVHTSTSIQHVQPRPNSLLIVGAGPIGLEFASMFNGFGTEVTVLDRGEKILPREDEEVAEAVDQVLQDFGITFLHSSGLKSIEEDGTVELEINGSAEKRQFDAILVAIGRRPATDDLGLDKAGIETTDRGAVQVDEYLRTSVDGVFAIGDVAGGQQQTYLSLDDFRVVLDQLTSDNPSRSTDDRKAVPATIFLTPPFSSVGLTEKDAREQGKQIKVATQEVAKIKAMPRPKAVNDPRGLIKFVVDAQSDEILGARLFHVDSQEVINLVSLAMRAGITATELKNGIWTHPSSTEALNETLGQLK